MGLSDPLVGEPVASTDSEEILSECDAANLRRLRIFLPIVAVFHAASLLLHRAVLPPEASDLLRRWQANLAHLHATMLIFALVASALVWGLRNRVALEKHTTLVRVLPVFFQGSYLLWAILLALNSQQARPNLDTYALTSLLMAATMLTPFWASTLVQGLGLACLLVGLSQLQENAPFLRQQLLHATVIAAVSVVLSYVLNHRFVSLVRGRLTIEQQTRKLEEQSRELSHKKEDLERLNSELEERVQQKVHLALQQARELELLNRQLQERVKARSRELSTALAKMASDQQHDTLPSGTLLGDRVRIVRRLGAGGMGTVYEGVDTTTGEGVAVKVLQANHLGPDNLQRFLREALAAASVSHPAVVRTRLVDVSEDGLLFQVQDLVQGVSLHQILEVRRSVAPAEAARLGAGVASALVAAHNAGVIHRDIKPSNLMITFEGTGLILLDFGISRLVTEQETPLTQTGQIVGTPEYLSPEQIVNPSQAGPASDIYALGVMLYRMIAGGSPFGARVSLELLAAHMTQAPQELAAEAPGTPMEVSALIMACMAKIPEERPGVDTIKTRLQALADKLGAPSMKELARRWLSESNALDATQPGTTTPSDLRR